MIRTSSSLSAMVACVIVLSSAPVFAQDGGVATTTTALEAQRLETERLKLEEIARAEEQKSAEATDIDFGAQMIKTFFVLGGVCLLAYLILGKLLPKVMKMTPAGRHGMLGSESKGLIEVIDRLPLDPKRSVYVMKVGQSHFLVGVSEQGMSVLSRLDPEDIQLPLDEEKRSSLLGRLPGMFPGRAEKES